jgi:L-ascorbate metabolism protein UlaG (beta-lactamase superfamily)
MNVAEIEELNIYHLDHSGVVVETSDYFLIFDYYNDTPINGERSLENGVLSSDILKDKDNIFVFVSHNHSDHFNHVIFDWTEENRDIKYILSDDVVVPKKDNYYMMTKYEELKLDELYIKTYGTTDQGVSFYVEVDGVNIFHSGDLNWWHWKKFSPEERKREEMDYKEELNRLKGREIDVAFVPVDPRLEEYYYLAGRYFTEKIAPELIVPIHFRDNYYITKEFVKEISDLSVETVEIKERGEKISWKKD